MRRSSDFQDGQVLANAFHRRDTDNPGISVDYDVEVPGGCGKTLNKKYAVVSLHVGHVRELGLDVVISPESDPEYKTHADITGLPLASSENVADILVKEQKSAKLAEQARTVWTK